MLPGDALCDDWTYLIKHFEVYNVVCVLVCNIDAVNPDVDGTDAVSVSVCLALRMYEVMRCCAFSI